MKYTEDEILNDYGHFRAFLEGLDRLSSGITLLGSPAEYERHWDFIRECVLRMCPNLTAEFVDTFDEATCDIARDRINEGLRTHRPLPKDFDPDKDMFEKLKPAMEKVREYKAKMKKQTKNI